MEINNIINGYNYKKVESCNCSCNLNNENKDNQKNNKSKKFDEFINSQNCNQSCNHNPNDKNTTLIKFRKINMVVPGLINFVCKNCGKRFIFKRVNKEYEEIKE